MDVIWSSNGSADYARGLSDEEKFNHLVDRGYDPEMLGNANLDDVINDDDYMWQDDSEEFDYNILPMINKQTYDGVVIMVNENGDGKAVYADELKGGDIDPNVNNVKILDDGEGLIWDGDGKQYMLFAVPEDEDQFNKFVNACLGVNDEDELVDRLRDDDLAQDINLNCDFTKVGSVCPRIKSGAGDVVYGVEESLNEDAPLDNIDLDVIGLKACIVKNVYYEPGTTEINTLKDGSKEYVIGFERPNSGRSDIMILSEKQLKNVFNKYDNVIKREPDILKNLSSWARYRNIVKKNKKMFIPESLNESSVKARKELIDFIKFQRQYGKSSARDVQISCLLDLAKDLDQNVSSKNPNESGVDFVKKHKDANLVDLAYALADRFAISLKESLNEATTKDPEGLAAELEEIKSLANDYGFEYFTAMPLTNFDDDPTSIEYQYPHFFGVIKAFFKEMGIAENPDDDDELDMLWDSNVDQHDWDTMIKASEYLIDTGKVQMDKVYKQGYESPLKSDKEILADREPKEDEFEESLETEHKESLNEVLDKIEKEQPLKEDWEDNGYKQHVWIIVDNEDDAKNVADEIGQEPDGEGDWDDGRYVMDYYFDDIDSAMEFTNNLPDVEWEVEEMDEALEEANNGYSVEIDWADEDLPDDFTDKDVLRSVKAAGCPRSIHVEVMDIDGPGGGWPEIRLSGPKEIIKRFLMKTGFEDMIEEDLDDDSDDVFDDTVHIYQHDYDGTPESLDAIRQDLLDQDMDDTFVDEVVKKIEASKEQ